MNQEKNQFRLEIRKDGLSPMKIDVLETISVGHDPRNDLVLIGKKIQKKHLLFQVKGENLALTYLGLTNQTFLNHLPLEEGKAYLLDVGDVLYLGEAKITILRELVHIHETQKLKEGMLQSKKIFDDMTPEMLAFEETVAKTRPEVKKEEKTKDIKIPIAKGVEEKKSSPFSLSSLLSLWAVKIYSIIIDVFITYLFLVVVLPLLRIDIYAQEVLFYLKAILFPRYSHSFFGFLIAWYTLSFAQTLIFGGTIGQFLVGLTNLHSGTFGRILLARIKTFLYSLLLLPSQNSYKASLPFRAMRKGGVIFILVFIIISPYLLPLPFNSQVTLLEESSYKKELHTQSVNSSSKVLSMNLSLEIPFRYMLLPRVSGGLKRRTFEFIDLKEEHSIIVEEEEAEFSYQNIEARLEYGNPLYKMIRKKPLENLSFDLRKELIKDVFLSSPLKIKNSLMDLGPFFGSAVLLKNALLNKNPSNDLVIKTFYPHTPLLYVGSSQQDYFYLLEKERLVRFLVKGKNASPLTEAFLQIVFNKLVTIPEDSEDFDPKNASILEVQDAFLHGDDKTVLTYYSAVATNLKTKKVIYEEVDLTDKARLALKVNIESILKFITDRSVERSLQDIINQLTPMENPGGKDE